MCRRTSRKCMKTPLSSNFAKVAVILAFFFFAECAAGSCLSYGHACWGAHGKRSGSQATFSRANDETPSTKDEAKAKWFLSKLISPLDLRYYRENEAETPRIHPEVEDLFTDIDKENSKSFSEWDNLQDILKTDNLIDESARNGRNVESIFKTPKFVDKRSIKQN